MKKYFEIKKFVNMKARLLIVSGICILCLVIGSSIAIPYTGFLDCNKSFDIKKNIVNHTEFSPKLELAPENPEFVKYQRKILYNPANFYSLDKYRTGFIPAPVDLRHLSTHSHPMLGNSISGTNSTPTHYDSRELSRITHVKDQGNAGNCWAFATYASLESYLMPLEDWDFSENNLKNLLSPASPEGFDLNEGGNMFMSTAYLARWNGPIAGKSDPYNDSSSYSTSELGLPLKKHVQNVLFLPNRHGSLDNEEIKRAVQNYGAVWTTLYYNPTSYSSTKHNYYYKGTSSPNHAVAIVGWNDSFDKNNFSQVPPGNGAFIVKNSWGPLWGDNGYFYVSYDDSSIGSANNGVFTAENTGNYKHIYQYDPLGWTGNFGYGGQTGWCANIFTAKSSEVLNAISFYTTDSNCNYKIYIYTNPHPLVKLIRFLPRVV
jgi:C1A family cysteine protease